MTSPENEHTNNSRGSGDNRAELLVGIAAAVVIVAALAFLTYQAVAEMASQS